MVFDNDFITFSFLRSGDGSPSWTSLVYFCTELSTDTAYDLISWEKDKASYPTGSPSKEENLVAILLDCDGGPINIPASKEAPTTAFEEAPTITSEESTIITTEEYFISKYVEEPYRMNPLPKLDYLSLRRSKRLQIKTKLGLNLQYPF